jgi:hypothetical protein
LSFLQRHFATEWNEDKRYDLLQAADIEAAADSIAAIARAEVGVAAELKVNASPTLLTHVIGFSDGRPTRGRSTSAIFLAAFVFISLADVLVCPLCSVRTQRSNTVFISFRMNEVMDEALQLKSKLEAFGVSTFVCDTQPGGNLLSDISHAISNCDLAVILGTETFGIETDVKFSTLDELMHIRSERKPIFLIKMCDRFDSAEVRFCFPESTLYTEWPPHTAMPTGLVREILDKIAFSTRALAQ